MCIFIITWHEITGCECASKNTIPDYTCIIKFYIPDFCDNKTFYALLEFARFWPALAGRWRGKSCGEKV